LMGSFMVLPTILAGSTMSGVMHDTSKPVRIVLASDNRALAELVRGELNRDGRGRYLVTTVSPASETERTTLTKRLNASDLDGYVWLDGPARASRRVVLTTNRMGDFILQGRLTTALSYAFAADAMVRRGTSADDVAATLQRVDLTTVRPTNSFSVYNAMRGAAVVFILLFVMCFSLLSYGVMVMRSVMEEKS